MSTATATAPESDMGFALDAQMFKAIRDSVGNALTMCNERARCVGVSAVPSHEPGLITGMIGVHGKVSGFVTVNMSERVAIKAVSGLIQEELALLSPQVIDGVGEITNIIVGGIKAALSNSAWSFPYMTVPSVIVGNGYSIAYAKGLEFLCATFEHLDPDSVMLEDRIMQVSISLLRL